MLYFYIQIEKFALSTTSATFSKISHFRKELIKSTFYPRFLFHERFYSLVRVNCYRILSNEKTLRIIGFCLCLVFCFFFFQFSSEILFFRNNFDKKKTKTKKRCYSIYHSRFLTLIYASSFRGKKFVLKLVRFASFVRDACSNIGHGSQISSPLANIVARCCRTRGKGRLFRSAKLR